MNEETAKSTDMQSMAEPMIEIKDMHKWFGDFHVLRGINLTIHEKERIVICGPSGSGKPTLIRKVCILPQGGDRHHTAGCGVQHVHELFLVCF